MTMSTPARRKGSGKRNTVIIAAALTASQQAWSGLVYDLRFTDGTHAKSAAAGDVFTIELWARVSGTNGNNNDEGIQSSLLKIQSTQTSGGALVSGGFTSGSVAPEFQSFSGTTALHQNGSGSDLNLDGITDWGSSSTSIANTNYMFARAGGIITGPSVGQAVDANTWEFKLATFTVSAAAMGTGTTAFNVVKPNATGAPIAVTYATGRVDNTTFNVTSSNQQGTYTGSLGITFTPVGPAISSSIGWDGGATAAGSEWTEPANWAFDANSSTEHVPSGAQSATFGPAGTASTVGINMAGSTNNGAANQVVESVVLEGAANRNITIENSSSTNGILRIEGSYGTIIANRSLDKTLTFQDGATGRMTLLPGTSSNIEVTNSAATVVISSAISGATSITKTGTGSLVLGGMNTNSGSLVINSGRVSLTSTGAIANPSIIIASDAMLGVAGILTAGNPTITTNGQVTLSSPSQVIHSLTGSGVMTLDTTALTLKSGTFAGQIIGTGSLKTDSGFFGVALTGTNSYTGGTTIASGELLGNTNSLKGVIVDNSWLTFTQPNAGTFAGSISGTGSVQKIDSGSVYLIGAATYSGSTVVAAGALAARAANVFSAASTHQVSAAGALQLDGPFDQVIGGLTGNGTVDLGVATGATPTLTVGANNASTTFAGTILHGGNVMKVGLGDLTLTGNNTYTGSTTVNMGRLIISGKSASPSYRAGAGAALRFSNGATTANGATLRADSGGGIEYLSPTINGGFIQGPGAHSFIGSSNALSGSTIFSGAKINIYGDTQMTSVVSSGNIFVEFATLNWSGGFIGAAGKVDVLGIANLSGVDSIGQISVTGTLNNTETNLVVGGGSRTTVNGGHVNLLGGTSLDVSGGLLVNNGVITGDINAYYGSTVKGGGTFNGTVNLFDGARFSPGNSPGSATVGSMNFAPGGSYLFELADATGAPGFGSDFLDVVNSLTVTAGNTANSRFLLALATLDQFNNPGAPLNFNPAQDYHWILAHTGSGITGFSPNLFSIDSSGFLSPTNGGSFNISQSGNNLLLNFNPVPEPTGALLTGAFSIAGLLNRRRR